MSGNCCFLNPLQRDGISQRQRLEEALRPSYVAVDERDLSDLLLYARNYAQLLQYYTNTNSRGGDWVEFIDSDISTLIAIIHNTNYEVIKKQFSQQLDAIKKKTLPQKKLAYGALLETIFQQARLFDKWYRDSVSGLSLQTALQRLIGSVLADTLLGSLKHLKRAQELGLAVEDVKVTEFSSIWKLDTAIVADSLLFPSAPLIVKDELDIAIDQIEIAFNDFYDALVYIINNAEGYLKETLDDYPEHQPHMALFIAFLQIFRYAQSHLNTITARHLDFYYMEVLGLEHKAAVPDQVHLVFELAKSAFTQKIAEKTHLKAGKDSEGKNLFYTTDSELVVNRASLDKTHGLKTLFVDKNEKTAVVKNIYAATDADTADGISADIEDEQGKWLTFGDVTMPYATIGFAIASPMFFLAEGSRHIILRFNLKSITKLFNLNSDSSKIEEELQYNVKISATGEKEWLELVTDKVDLSSISATVKYLEFRLSLGADDGAVVAYDAKLHGDGFSSSYPLLKFTLDNSGLPAGKVGALSTAAQRVQDYSDEISLYNKNDLVRFDEDIYQAQKKIDKPGFRPPDFPLLWGLIEPSYPYKYFQSMEIIGLDIRVTVGGGLLNDVGVKNLILENDVGSFDPAKPFYPFGPVPRKGSRFFIGSHEVFQKRLTALNLSIEWTGLPDQSFKFHYASYKSTDTTPAEIVTANSYFTATFNMLKGGVWSPVTGCAGQQLFGSIVSVPPKLESAPAVKRKITISSITAPSSDGCGGDDDLLERDAELPPFNRLDTTLKQGFFSISLEQSFLHETYPRVLGEAARTLPPGTFPNQPYTPMMASFSLGYSAHESIDYCRLKKDDFKHRVEQIYQIGPFGSQEIFPIADDAAADEIIINRKLVPEFTVTSKDAMGNTETGVAEGTLYLGIEKLDPAQNLSILFQVAEGSEVPTLSAQHVVWSYLTNQGWVDFDVTEIIADSTNGLLGSGVIKFAMPKAMTKSSTILPAKLYWIKGSVLEKTIAIPQMIALHLQAAVANFHDQNNSPKHLAQALPAETIGKLKSRNAAIKSVTQPYASFDGHIKESDELFYQRVSERLRHKNRVITLFDYERMVLEQFPDIYKVKCVNHTSRSSEHAPGYVRVVVVPDLRNKNAVDQLKPQVSLNKLTKIAEYLTEYAPDFVRITVTNPEYEEIKVNFNVQFNSGLDKGLYTTELNQSIINFLSPWLYDAAADITFGGRIHRSSILDFVEKQSYVDFVTEFTMDHCVNERWKLNVEEAITTTTSSALTSAAKHDINHDINSCGGFVRKHRCNVSLTGSGSGVDNCCPGNVVFPVSNKQPSKIDLSKEHVKNYLGNSHTRELHDLNNISPMCHIDVIDKDRRYLFSTVSEALDMNYDYCAHCFSRELSKR